MKLKFLGANRQVTGSCYVLTVGEQRVMIDCGMFQERRHLGRNWTRCPQDPAGIESMLLTHAHLDHCGLIPKLCKDGFGGDVYATEPTVELAQLIMNDSGKIQVEDAKYKKKRHKREGRTSPHGYEPLYTIEDAHAVETRFRPVNYGQPTDIGKHLRVTWHEAGHILGSACLEVNARENGVEKTIVFSGDLGQWDSPIVGDPTLLDQADYVVMESTYGDRSHKDHEPVRDQLARVINETVERGGNVVIPTFAVERAQDLMLHLAELVYEKRVPRLPVFLDSPMAVNATEVFRRHGDYMDADMQEIIESGRLRDAWDWIHLTRTVEASKAINAIRGSAIIMAGSGMCTGGRIKHHLVANISRPESTLVFVGYQAQGTLGRLLLERRDKVRIFGIPRLVAAGVEQIDGLSAHGDREDLLRWAGAFGTLQRMFLTHGDDEASEHLAGRLREQYGYDVVVPDYLDEVHLA